MDEVRVTIIGAGVVGLAIASELSRKFDDIVVLERHDSFGQEISSRNSEVLHSGIYYPQGSLKARLCVEGIDELYRICGEYSVPHRKSGKLIVAADQSELGALEDIFNKGLGNNVKDLSLIDGKAALQLEPNINALAAIYSPNTGIIDTHSLMKHFCSVAEERGVIVSYNSEVIFMEKQSSGFILGIKEEDYRLKSRIVINSAGLASDRIASLAGIDVESSGYRLKPCKGSYFSYAKPSPVNMLVYPVPWKELVGLGVHATLDLASRLRFGPDAEYIDEVDYNVDAGKRDIFYASARKIIPGLDRESFVPDMAGIRPKLQGPGEKTRDFMIQEESEKGLNGLINLIGIESPGLTASPAIAGMVSSLVSEIL